MLPRASIIIVTRNRRDDLERALASSRAQEGENEIIVIDDGSTDGTGAMVRGKFPSAILVCEKHSRGYIVQRNRAARMATGDILISIDDDAEFSAPDIVARTIRDVTDSDDVAAVAIPYTESPDHHAEHQRAPDTADLWITSQFIGTAYAIRRGIFLELGGFDETLVHQGEERDFCLRLLQAGHWVRLGNAAPIRHHYSPVRDLARMAFYGRRNDILFAWKNIPFPQFMVRLAGTAVKGIAYGIRSHQSAASLLGMCDAMATIAGGYPHKPVKPATYAHYRRLIACGPEKC